MKKTLFTLAAVIALSGCSTPGALRSRDTSPVQNFRMPTGELLSISGHHDRTYVDRFDRFTNKLNVFFDNELGISGFLSAESTGDLTGKWRDHNVSASCSSSMPNANWMDIRCIIFIENERTVTLSF